MSEQKKHITETVKSFEDACLCVGIDPLSAEFTTGTPDEIAYKKLKVIAKALNEGVELSFANRSQLKWYPWFIYWGSGFRFNVACYVLSYTYSAGSSRICFATDDLAIYAGTQFIDLYNQLLK